MPSTQKNTSMSVVPTAYAASVDPKTVESSSSAQTATKSESQLNFIGPSHAVKELFALPYTNETVSVAVHNLSGTLLMESDVENLPQQQQDESQSNKKQQRPSPASRRRKRPTSFLSQRDSNDTCWMPASAPNHQLEGLSSGAGSDPALALVNSMLQLPPSESQKMTPRTDNCHVESEPSSPELQQQQGGSLLSLPPPEYYPSMPPIQESRQFFSCHLSQHDLLVGSDVAVLRSPQQQPPTEETVLRVAELSEMKALLSQSEQERAARRSRSYAEALASSSETKSEQVISESATLASPDPVPSLQLQTCIATSATNRGFLHTPYNNNESSSNATTSSSAVCTVMDAYLDNIITNVPQLALVLREKGFIQSVKLFRTEDIPSSYMHASTLDATTAPPSQHEEPLFSPKIMEMNASTLLQFLQANCTRDNATYLLRREAGQTNLQLYDISSISAQRQRKWMWWLAMMSYRFALRLKHLSTQQDNRHGRKRTFRARQRSLLENALELLEELADFQEGGHHETLCAAVREHLADTYLVSSQEGGDEDGPASTTSNARQLPAGLQGASHQQPYASVSTDALTKAQDHLIGGIKILWPLVEQEPKSKTDHGSVQPEAVTVAQRDGGNSSGSDDELTDNDEAPVSLEVTLQLFGLHHKLIHVSLRLVEHHFETYFSSSAMQALRLTARRLADAANLLLPLELQGLLSAKELQQLQESLLYQYTWLWEHCGHFARSFAGDELWRERGHSCGDDILNVLRDVATALKQIDVSNGGAFGRRMAERKVPLTVESRGFVGLHSVSGALDISRRESLDNESTERGWVMVELTQSLLNRQKQIQRDQREVLVAATVSYSCAISALQELSEDSLPKTGQSPLFPQEKPFHHEENFAGGKGVPYMSIISLLRKRLGDACNEIGKILLTELRSLLSTPAQKVELEVEQIPLVAAMLLGSAQFWFEQGLESFEACIDLRNIALLRCNLCQCCKLRANSNVSSTTRRVTSDSGANQAEVYLQDAADHLQKAHDALAERDVDPTTWDMVSQELAATFLVLGVRRRQSLLGGGTAPLVLHAMRLSPGQERSIVEPMERSLQIYAEYGNSHQVAAVNYQLALFYSKVWTCQRDEKQTREKLSAAFRHFAAAHAYFSHSLAGNEPTFVILSLDLANLYAAVSGEECLRKALSRCLDTADAFSSEYYQSAMERGSKSFKEWSDKMCTLAPSVEDRVFKLLLSLVKIEKETQSGDPGGDASYKEVYRVALSAKLALKSRNLAPGTLDYHQSVRNMLLSIKETSKLNA